MPLRAINGNSSFRVDGDSPSPIPASIEERSGEVEVKVVGEERVGLGRGAMGRRGSCGELGLTSVSAMGTRSRSEVELRRLSVQGHYKVRVLVVILMVIMFNIRCW